LYLYEIKGFFSHKQEETRKERRLVWATAVDDTRKMTDFMTYLQGVGAFGGLRRSRSALARHLHRQKNRVGKNAQET